MQLIGSAQPCRANAWLCLRTLCWGQCECLHMLAVQASGTAPLGAGACALGLGLRIWYMHACTLQGSRVPGASSAGQPPHQPLQGETLNVTPVPNHRAGPPQATESSVLSERAQAACGHRSARAAGDLTWGGCCRCCLWPWPLVSSSAQPKTPAEARHAGLGRRTGAPAQVPAACRRGITCLDLD